MTHWYLEGYFDKSSILSSIPLKHFPQILGRDELLTYSIHGPSVSRCHAQMFEEQGCLWVEDLGSRNGTFVNSKKITQPTVLLHGDILHLGKTELRILDRDHMSTLDKQIIDDSFVSEPHGVSTTTSSDNLLSGERELEELIDHRLVHMVYQPVILGANQRCCGYEILGRGASALLPTSPKELLTIAEGVGLEVDLSELLRKEGVATAAQLHLHGDLLLNTHSSEVHNLDRLLSGLRDLTKKYRSNTLVLEVHEKDINNDWALRKTLKDELKKINVKFALDDSGLSQFQLLDMAEAKPDIIKFNQTFIQDTNFLDTSAGGILRQLKKLADKLDIQTLAEYVSNEAEYLVCKKISFEMYQGFYFSKPKPAIEFSNPY